MIQQYSEYLFSRLTLNLCPSSDVSNLAMEWWCCLLANYAPSCLLSLAFQQLEHFVAVPGVRETCPGAARGAGKAGSVQEPTTFQLQLPCARISRVNCSRHSCAQLCIPQGRKELQDQRDSGMMLASWECHSIRNARWMVDWPILLSSMFLGQSVSDSAVGPCSPSGTLRAAG